MLNDERDRWQRDNVDGDEYVHPIDDLRGHEVHSALCPCLPRVIERGTFRHVIHNSYDGREVGEVCSKALDMLGVALADHGHTWTDEQREAYENARHVLEMHYDVHEPGT